MDDILHQIFKILLNISKKNMRLLMIILQSLMIYVNKIELLTPETMKLRGSTKNKIFKDENSESVLDL